MVPLLGQLTAPLVVLDSAVNQPLLVGAAGVVVVLAILLVFVMVLRGGKRTPAGIGYDMQQGPLGQPKAPPSQPGTYGQRGSMPAQGWGQPADYGADYGAPAGPSGQGLNGAQGWGQGFAGQGYPGQNAWNEPAPAQAPAWGVAAPGMGAQGGQWAGQQDQGGWGQAPTAQPALQSGWGQPQNPPAAGWGQPADAGAGWGAPAAPSTPQQGYGAPPAGGGGWTGGMAPMGGNSGGNAGGFGAGGYGEPDRGRAARPAGAQRAALLIVRQGKEPGRTYEVRKDRMTIGRSRESDIFLEDLAVSRTHTSVGRDEQGRYIVRDENSANGTYVNGQRISEYLLEDGDEIQIGQTVLAFTRR